MIDKIENNIFRLKVPFEGFFTSVYFYICAEGVAIIDCATFSEDVDKYILPALEELDVSEEDVKFILLSHNHGDHRGGLVRLAEIFCNAAIGTACDIPFDKFKLTDNMHITGELYAIALPGHTADSFGFFDTASGTLLSADCLQLDGVDKYRNGIEDFSLYINSVEKLRVMNINRIVAAHDYIPLGSVAQGGEEVELYLSECIRFAKEKM